MSDMTTQEMIEWLQTASWMRPHKFNLTSDEACNAIAARLKTLEKAERERDEARKYITHLIHSLCPECEACSDLLGVCTQIDNLLAGTVRERDEARAALRPFAEIEPSTLYCDEDGSGAYDPGYVILLCEDYQRPDISREELIKARAALGGEG